MKIFVLLISFFLINNFVYSQSDSLKSSSSSIIDNLDSSSVENNETVSMAGALSFSLILPGAGLFLSDNSGPAIAYLSVAGVSYILGVVLLTAGEVSNDEGAYPYFVVGGIVHYLSILHTLFATLDYNESINPYITYNGKMYQFGLSVKF